MQQILNIIDQLMGQKLVQRRSELKLTSEELANKLEISTDQLETYEQGKRRMDAATLHKASEIFGVEMIYFFEDNVQDSASKINEQQKLKVSLSPEEEALLLGSLAEIDDPVIRKKSFELFKMVKVQLN